MANDIQSRVWALDTVTAGSLLPTNVKVDHMEFSGYAAATDNATLLDANGKIVWQAHGTTDLQEVRTGKVGWVSGLRLSVITSGKVLVYLG